METHTEKFKRGYWKLNLLLHQHTVALFKYQILNVVSSYSNYEHHNFCKNKIDDFVYIGKTQKQTK